MRVLLGLVWVFGHCNNEVAAMEGKYVVGMDTGTGHCNNAAEGGGRVKLAGRKVGALNGTDTGHWRTPVTRRGGKMEVWGGEDASIVLAGVLVFLDFLVGGRLERARERDFGGTRFLGAGVGPRGSVGGFFGSEVLGVRGFGGIECV